MEKGEGTEGGEERGGGIPENGKYVVRDFIPVYSGLFRFIPNIPGFYSGYSGTFLRESLWTQVPIS